MSDTHTLPALLFDLDGTLLDTAPDLHKTLNHCLKHAGRETVSLESVQHMVGQGARILLERGMKATGGMPDDETFENLVILFFDYYADHLSDHSYPYPSMMDVLDKLHNSGYLMAVCTNKPFGFAKTIIDDYGLAKYFPVITGGDSFDFRKPDPRHITETIAQMPNRSTGAIMIGDTHNDIDAANSASIGSIAVSFGYSDKPASELGAHITIDHFDELIAAIEDLTPRL